MPGLYALSSWEALPLKSSRVKACANGYALSIAAHLVYTNPREEPVEGKRGCRNPKTPRAGEHPVPSPFPTQGHPSCPAARVSFWGLCLGAVSHPQASSSTRWRSRRWWPASRRRRAAGGSPSRCRAGTGRRTAASSAAPAPGGRAAVPPVSTTVPLFAWQGGGQQGVESPSQAIPVPWRPLGLGDPGVPSPGGWRSRSSSSPLPLCPGHLVLDEDAERSTFVISTGSLGPAESLAVTLRTAQELPTLPGGALRLVLPPVLVPRVAAAPERESEPGSLCDDRLALW